MSSEKSPKVFILVRDVGAVELHRQVFLPLEGGRVGPGLEALRVGRTHGQRLGGRLQRWGTLAEGLADHPEVKTSENYLLTILSKDLRERVIR